MLVSIGPGGSATRFVDRGAAPAGRKEKVGEPACTLTQHLHSLGSFDWVLAGNVESYNPVEETSEYLFVIYS